MPIVIVREPDPASSFATAADLVASWHALSDAETARAEVVLAQASRMIRRLYPDVDDRIAAGSLSADDVADVALAMTERRMSSSTLGATQFTESMGPFSRTAQTSVPLGVLGMSDEDRATFEVVGQQRGANWSWVS